MTQPLLLVAISVLVSVLGSNGYGWLVSTGRVGAAARLPGEGWCARWAWPWPVLVRDAYLAGFPILAIALRRAGPATAWGFEQPISAFGVSLALLGGSVVASVLLLQARTLGGAARSVSRPRAVLWQELGFALVHAFALELHWALYRAGCLSVGLPSPTTAVYLSLCLLALESWASPATRQAWRELTTDPRPLWPAAACILSASLFLRTGSVPLCVAGHFWLALFLLLGQLRWPVTPGAAQAVTHHGGAVAR